jgi:hypothetical protein
MYICDDEIFFCINNLHQNPLTLFSGKARNPTYLKKIDELIKLLQQPHLIIYFDQSQGTVFSVIGISVIYGKEETKTLSFLNGNK